MKAGKTQKIEIFADLGEGKTIKFDLSDISSMYSAICNGKKTIAYCNLNNMMTLKELREKILREMKFVKFDKELNETK